MGKPVVFIGSSSEGIKAARAIQCNLEECCQGVVWDQGVFMPGNTTLERLVSDLHKYDYAILIFSPDDELTSRGQPSQAPRDNVLLEVGLFIGAFGRERTFVVVESSAALKIPSDLAGVTLLNYLRPDDPGIPLRSAVGPACYQIENVIRQQGVRPRPAHPPVLPATAPRLDLEAARSEVETRVDSASDILGADAGPPGIDTWYKQILPLLNQVPTYGTPTYFLDNNLKFMDWNIAFELIFSDITPILRYRHVNEFMARLANFDDVIDHAREFTRKVHNGCLPYIDTEPLVYRSRRYGDVRFLKVATQLHQDDGEPRGWAVALLPEVLDWRLFQKDITERIQSDKMWSLYSVSYDRVLTDYPPYKHLLEDVAGVVPAEARSALDVGAGTGNSTRVLLDKGLRVTSVESNSSMIQRLRKRGFDPSRHRLVKASAEGLNFLAELNSNNFDAAIAVNVLYGLDDPYACLTGIARVLKPYGVLGLSTTHSGSNLGPLLKDIRKYVDETIRRDAAANRDSQSLTDHFERVDELNRWIESVLARRHTADNYCEMITGAGFEITRRVDSTYQGAVMLVHARKR